MTPPVVHLASGREWRGGQNQVWLLARALQRHGGIDQSVVTGAGSELETRLAAAGVPRHAVSWGFSLDPRALWATLRAVRAHGARCVLHAHDAHALILAGLAASLTGARLVATRRLDFHLHRRGYWARADRVVAISAAVAAILREDGVPAERIVMVHDGIALDEVRVAVPHPIREQLGLPAGAPLAVNVAALVGHKDHATLLEAAARLRATVPALHWVIAGEGRLRPALERQIEDLALRDRVHLLGHVPYPLGLIAAADVFVFSSREEGLGTSVLDAMALRVPVVATDAGGIPEMLGGGAGLLCPRGRPEALAAAVGQVLADPALRASLVAVAAARVEGFSDHRMAEEMISVYRSVDSA